MNRDWEYELVLSFVEHQLAGTPCNFLPFTLGSRKGYGRGEGKLLPYSPWHDREQARNSAAREARALGAGARAYVAVRSEAGFELFSAGEWSEHTFVDDLETWERPLALRPPTPRFRLLPTVRGRRSSLAGRALSNTLARNSVPAAA